MFDLVLNAPDNGFELDSLPVFGPTLLACQIFRLGFFASERILTIASCSLAAQRQSVLRPDTP